MTLIVLSALTEGGHLIVMRMFSTRVTALVATSIAISVASMLASAPRFENGRDLDSVIRKTRSGPQRDAGDAIDHHFEAPDPVTVVIGDSLSTSDRQARVHAPPGAAVLPPGPAAPPGPDTFSLSVTPPASSTLLARSHTPCRRRAPPTT